MTFENRIIIGLMEPTGTETTLRLWHPFHQKNLEEDQDIPLDPDLL